MPQLVDIRREEFFSSAGPGVNVTGNSLYTRASGVEKMRFRGTVTQSDKTDTLERSFSPDNGRTWSQPEALRTWEQRPEGVLRRSARPGFVDPDTDRLIELVVTALLPTDDPREGLRTRRLSYRVSQDGGHTYAVDEPVVAAGHTASHPLPGVWAGKNGVNVGDRTCRPVRLSHGHMLFPLQIAPLGPDGEYYNPGGGYTYGEAACLLADWKGDGALRWELSERVPLGPERSTRGSLEPTVAELDDGRVLMVFRGSNDVRPELPGHKWSALSADGGRTWSGATPWRCVDGEPFFSPSSCSQLLRHSGGRLFWLGNLCSGNPRGNRPRYPLVIAEVDAGSGLLQRDTETAIDDRGPADSERLSLSSFMAHEDRVTGEILLHMSRAFAGSEQDRASPAYLHRLALR